MLSSSKKAISTPRLDWDTGTIVSRTVDKDNLVWKVMVQPHTKPGQHSCSRPKERAIHDLVLLKAITAKDNGAPDSTTFADAPPEATVFKCSILDDDPELFKIFPEECPGHASWKDIAQRPIKSSIQRPRQLIEPMPQEDAVFLQTSADALLNKINTLRCELSLIHI